MEPTIDTANEQRLLTPEVPKQHQMNVYGATDHDNFSICHPQSPDQGECALAEFETERKWRSWSICRRRGVSHSALLAIAVALAAALLQPPVQAQACNASLERLAYPDRVVTPKVGFSGFGYLEQGLIAPRAVPVGVNGFDADTIRTICGATCNDTFAFGQSEALWSLEADCFGHNSPTPSICYFLDQDASRVLLKGGLSVMLLPIMPNYADVGAVFQGHIRATVFDPLATGVDQDTVVRFLVSITRTSAKLIDVEITVVEILGVNAVLPPCEAPGGNCELVGAGVLPDQVPSLVASSIPSKMIAGEVRPLYAVVRDADIYVVECGTPPGQEPVSSDFGNFPFDDSVLCFWSILPTPGFNGNGVFRSEYMTGDVRFFHATEPGMVRVLLNALSQNGGDDAQFTFDIEIVRAVPEEVVIGEILASSGSPNAGDGKTQLVVRDDVHEPYLLPAGIGSGDDPAWTDVNHDGVSQLVGQERRFPVCYVAGERVGIRRLQFFTDSVRPMPGNLLVGRVNGRPEEYHVSPSLPGGSDESDFIARDFVADVPFGQEISYFGGYRIEWFTNPWGSTETQTGLTAHRMYVCAAPALDERHLFESVLDISCKAAHGVSASAGDEVIAAAVRDGFSVGNPGDEVRRKPVDGFHNGDGVQLVYWLNLNQPCQTLPDVMENSLGNVACQGFARLLQACFSVQGLDSDVDTVVSNPPHVQIAQTPPVLMVRAWESVVQSPPIAVPNAPWNYKIDFPPNLVGTIGVGTRIPAQGNTDSPATFNAHWVVSRNKNTPEYLIYDPSYGSKDYETQEEHEWDAFWGFYTRAGNLLPAYGGGFPAAEPYAFKNEQGVANCLPYN